MKLSKQQKWIGVSALLLVLITGGIGYYQFIYLPKQTASAQSVLQTSVARRGDLVIYASGTGTLVAEEYDLTFTSNSLVTGVYVKPGDQVKAGDLLAEVDASNAQAQFDQVKRKYDELTSDAAVASALQSVADADKELFSAKLQLEYLISPGVMYWETEVEEAQKTLDEARAAAAASPADDALQQAVRDAETRLVIAKDQLALAQEYYEDVYQWETFPIREKPNGDDYVLGPTELEIFSARADIDEAEKNLLETKYLYAALTGQELPADANSDALQELQQAKLDLEAAQENLDGTRLLAPIHGTVMTVNVTEGNSAGSSTAIVVADLSRVYLEIYLDASDWDKVAVGMETEITFDALPDQVFTGKVTELDQTLYSDRNTTAIRGIVSLDTPFTELNLPLGVSASVDVISAQARDAVLVPVEALHETSPGKYAVFVRENGKLRLRVVEVGIQDSISAEIISGLQPGEVVSTGITQTK